jgi:hypothetical protein
MCCRNAPTAGVRELICEPNTVDGLCEAMARFANAQTRNESFSRPGLPALASYPERAFWRAAPCPDLCLLSPPNLSLGHQKLKGPLWVGCPRHVRLPDLGRNFSRPRVSGETTGHERSPGISNLALFERQLPATKETVAASVRISAVRPLRSFENWRCCNQLDRVECPVPEDMVRRIRPAIAVMRDRLRIIA